MNARSTTPARPAESSLVPTLICHCERPSTGSGRSGISMRLNTRRRTAVATATGLPRYAHDDKLDTHTATGLPRYARNDKVVAHTTTGLPRYARNDKVDTQGQLSPVCWHRRSSGRQPPAQQQPSKQRRGFARRRMTPTHRVEQELSRGGAAGLAQPAFGLQSFVTIPAHERYGWRTATY